MALSPTSSHSSGGSLPAAWSENAVGGLSIAAPTNLGPSAAIVVNLASGTDPADENSVIQIFGRDATDQSVPYFDVDQGGGFFLQSLDPSAECFIAGASGANSVFRVADHTFAALFQVRESGAVLMPKLPTADPHVAGALWNNASILTVSAG